LINTTISNILAQILQLLPIQARLDLSTILSTLNLNGLAGNFSQTVQGILANLLGSILGGSPRTVQALKMEAEGKILDQLSQLGSTLTDLLGNVIATLIGSVNIGKRALDISGIVQAAFEAIKPILMNLLNQAVGTILNGKRDLLGTIVNVLGLGNVWTVIQSLGSSVVAQITAIGTQLLFAGQQIWAQAQPVLNQLVSDLINHAGDATTIVSQAVATLSQLLAQGGKRDILGTIVNVLGLGNVWTTIQALGSSVVAQFTAIGTQLLFAGQQILSQAKPILNQLVSDLVNHAGDATTIVAQAVATLNQLLAQGGKRDLLGTIVNVLGLGNVWTTIQALGSSVVAQITAIGTQLLFAGQQILSQAKPILNQLVSDLVNHAGDATTIVAQAVATLNQLLAQGK
jgi:cellobiose-specific phosphotransferase system component IIA